jgi:glycerol-3-phosphate dehydrogenase (NAD+)
MKKCKLHYVDLLIKNCFAVYFRGSVIAKIIGYNVQGKPGSFVEQVSMYVYEEIIDGKKLTEIINTQHENVKYLPGCKLPPNVVSNFND